jgi:arylsulfatase
MGAPKVIADGHFDRSYVIHDHDRYFSPNNHQLDDAPLPPVKRDMGFYLTSHIADRAIEFLAAHARDHAADPFCMYVAFTSPHFPLHALKDDIDRYREAYLAGWDRMRLLRWRRMRDMGLIKCPLPPPDPDIIPSWNLSGEKLADLVGPGEASRAVPWSALSAEQQRFQATKMAIHAAMVDRMDREIGRVMEQARRMGAVGDTIVFFVSDNGASAEQIIRGDRHDKTSDPGSARSYLCLGPGWSTCCNTPFRLHKSWVHEGGISSPLIVHWPSGIKGRGELRHTPCHFIDLIPTLAELAGAPVAPAWLGHMPPPLPGRSLVSALNRDVVVPRECLYFHHIANRALRVDDWKIVAAAGAAWSLYDLRKDRSETRDLAARDPGRVRDMEARWQAMEDEFRKQAGPP